MSHKINWQILIEKQPILAFIPASMRGGIECKKVNAGDTLFHLGSKPKHLFYLIEGGIHLLRRTQSGNEIILQRSTGGFIAEASIDAQTYHCNAVVTASGNILSLPIQIVKLVLMEDIKFQQAWTSLLTREVRKLRAQCERLSLKTAAERIIHYIETEGTERSLVLTQPLNAWAIELGLTHEALYRSLRKLQTTAVLTIDKSQQFPKLSLH